MTQIIRQRLVSFPNESKERVSKKSKGLNQSQSRCEDVAKFLYRIGIEPNSKGNGFNYMYTTILTCIEYISGHLIIEEVYRKVAQAHNTTMRNVEREIDIALKTVSNTPGCIEWKKEILGHAADRKLRNSQAIVFMARYLK